MPNRVGGKPGVNLPQDTNVRGTDTTTTTGGGGVNPNRSTDSKTQSRQPQSPQSFSNWTISKDGMFGSQTGSALFGASNWSKMVGSGYSKNNAFTGASSTVKAPIFRAGSSGDVVRQIQQRLANTMGSDGRPLYRGKIDGVYGGMTTNAVRNFQGLYNATSTKRAGSNVGSNYISEAARPAVRGQAVSPYTPLGSGLFHKANPGSAMGNNSWWGPAFFGGRRAADKGQMRGR